MRAVAIDAAGDVHASQHGRFVAPAADPTVPRGGHMTLSDLGPGRYQCRVAIHDTRTGRVGSLFLDVVADRD
jgi:hypothetical protein